MTELCIADMAELCPADMAELCLADMAELCLPNTTLGLPQLHTCIRDTKQQDANNLECREHQFSNILIFIH